MHFHKNIPLAIMTNKEWNPQHKTTIKKMNCAIYDLT